MKEISKNIPLLFSESVMVQDRWMNELNSYSGEVLCKDREKLKYSPC